MPVIFSEPCTSSDSSSIPATETSVEQQNYGLSEEQLQKLLRRGLKPEEIGASAEKRHERVHELLFWFARFADGHANPKWAVVHAFELAYFIATGGMNQTLNLTAVRKEGFLEGFKLSETDRAVLLRLKVIQPIALPDEDNLKARISQLETTVAELRQMLVTQTTS